MIVDKDTKTIQWLKSFSDNGAGTIASIHIQRMELILLYHIQNLGQNGLKC